MAKDNNPNPIDPNSSDLLDPSAKQDYKIAEEARRNIIETPQESSFAMETKGAKYVVPDTPWFDVTKFASLDEMFKFTQATGSIVAGMTDTLRGINNRLTHTYTLANRDTYGYIFFTRPQLNLSGPNIRNVRKMYSLLSQNEKSIFRYVRCMLDPRLIYNSQYKADSMGKSLEDAKAIAKGGLSAHKQETPPKGDPDAKIIAELSKDADGDKISMENDMDKINTSAPGIRCPLLDNELAFIPLLTNTCTRADGWPDTVAPTFTDKEGMRGEQWSIVDGYIDFYSQWDMDCTFSNIREEPLVLLFQTWLQYACYVFEDMLSPYIDYIRLNEIDYYSRCYRLVMDESNRFVKKMAATLCFPISVPMGKIFDYTRENNKYNLSNQELNIRFRCIGADYNDNILPYEFNEAMAIFNPIYRYTLNGITSTGKPPKEGLLKVPYRLQNALNHRAYPLINPHTLELEWYVKRSDPMVQVITETMGMPFNDNITPEIVAKYRQTARDNAIDDGVLNLDYV